MGCNRHAGFINQIFWISSITYLRSVCVKPVWYLFWYSQNEIEPMKIIPLYRHILFSTYFGPSGSQHFKPLQVWVQSLVSSIPCGCNPALVQSCVGATLCECNPVWVQSCAGAILWGWNPVWVQSCGGAIPCGMQSCGVQSHVGAILCGCNLLGVQ